MPERIILQRQTHCEKSFSQMFNEYLVNVKWEEPLDDGVVERIKLTG
jgi:hypothetical protein